MTGISARYEVEIFSAYCDAQRMRTMRVLVLALRFALVAGYGPQAAPSYKSRLLIRRQAKSTSTSASTSTLTSSQLDFAAGYLNKHHGDLLIQFAQVLSPLGAEVARANVWSGGSVSITKAIMTTIRLKALELDVTVEPRNKPAYSETVAVNLNADPIPEKLRQFPSLPQVPDDPDRLAVDDLVRRLGRLCWIVGMPYITGKLIQMALQLDGAGVGKLPENLYLNQVPHNRYVRQFFYDAAAEAVVEAVTKCSAQKHTNRMKVFSQFPEMNPSMDTYRIGTILELVRAIAIRLAEENLRVRVSVQGSMGVGIFTGMPKQLSGVSRLVQLMDWQSDPGENNQGMVGDYVNFGGVGAEHVVNERRNATHTLQHQDDVFLLIAPQSMVGTESSIMPLLSDMVKAAGDRPVILVNPDLTDKISAAGQQSVRGRQSRIDFGNSFETVFHFQNIYISGTSYFPILGAISKMKPSEPWIASQRRDFAGREGEIYVPVLASETLVDGQAILEAFER